MIRKIRLILSSFLLYPYFLDTTRQLDLELDELELELELELDELEGPLLLY